MQKASSFGWLGFVIAGSISLVLVPLLFAHAGGGTSVSQDPTSGMRELRTSFMTSLSSARSECRDLIGPDAGSEAGSAAHTACVQKYRTIAQEYTGALHTYIATLKEQHADRIAARKAERAAKIAAMKEEVEARREARFSKFCERYTASSAVPTGFGSAYNVAGNKAKLIALRCEDISGDVAVDVGDDAPTTLVYEKGYVYDGKSKAWKQVELNSDKAKTGPWYEGKAFADLDLEDTPGTPDASTWVLAYTCSKESGSWKCGCKDEECTNPGWQIQQVNRPAVPPPLP